MRLTLVLAMFLGSMAWAENGADKDADGDAQEVALSPEEIVFIEGDAPALETFLWVNRPIVVFADSTADPRFVQQMQFLTRDVDELVERDIVVMTDTDPGTLSPLREKLRPRGFMMVLIGKDGGVKLRKPLPWSVRELSRTIDKMPIRQQEIRDRRAAPEG